MLRVDTIWLRSRADIVHTITRSLRAGASMLPIPAKLLRIGAKLLRTIALQLAHRLSLERDFQARMHQAIKDRVG